MDHAIFTLIAGVLAVLVPAVILTFIFSLAEREWIPSILAPWCHAVRCPRAAARQNAARQNAARRIWWVSDAGAGFSLGESLVEWPMATTAVCKSAQASVRKIACITLFDLLFICSDPSSCGRTQLVAGTVTIRSHIARIRTGLLFQDISPLFTCSLLLAA